MKKSGSGTTCAVVGCNNSRKHLNEWLDRECYDHKPATKRQCPCAPLFKFHRKPDTDSESRAWLRALNLKNPPRNVFVCSYHFIDGKPTKENPFPELWLGYKADDIPGEASLDSQSPDFVPSVFPHSKQSPKGKTESSFPNRWKRRRNELVLETPEPSLDHHPAEEDPPVPRTEYDGLQNDDQFMQLSVQKWENRELQRAKRAAWLDHDYSMAPLRGAPHEAADVIQDFKAKRERATLPFHDILGQYCLSDDQIRFYTKLPSVSVFKIFWEHIAPSVSRLIYWNKANRMGEEAVGATVPNPCRSMPIINEFLMYSMRTAAGMQEQLLADMFRCSIATVNRVIITWANYLFMILGTVPLWGCRKKIWSAMPKKFRKHCPNVRVVLDRTVIAVTAPSSLTSHSETFSCYDSRTTFKGLIGVTPHGFVSFFSKLYTGCISDEEMTRLSGILQLLEPGDEVVADKGFLVGDLLSDVGAKLVIPLSKRSVQFSREDAEETHAIAHLKIIAEKMIERIKSNHIWDSPIPLALIGTVGQIWHNCCVMVNLQGPLYCKDYLAHTV